MSIRLAKESDLDAIAWISVAALPADPVCPYRFPYMHLYPEDHVKFSRIRYTEYMAAGDNVIMVFECPTIEDPAVHKPVAFSIWQLPGTHVGKASAKEGTEVKPKQKGPPDHLQRRDASAARMTAFRESIGRAKREMFDGPYGESQLYLGMLACHPDYQKRGAGRMLCQWGLDKAKTEGLTITLYASPMGARLYRSLGFQNVGSFRTQVEGEEEFLDTPGMVLVGPAGQEEPWIS
ncbi:hypothetical protein MMC11_008170 [Xylographa trunciseda]|nr:hypothetical protein [Xylographa trunciseda]